MKEQEHILNETRKLLNELKIKTPTDMAAYIDHTNLKPTVSSKDIELLCNDARIEHFRCVCVNPCWLDLAKNLLIGSDVKLCAAISFPFGSDTTATKIASVQNAIDHGASELDIVINIGFLKDRRENDVIDELQNIVQACRKADSNIVNKIIIETSLLSNEEIIIACKCIIYAEANFVKTSTGFSSAGGATVEDVEYIKKLVGDKARIKASGGIKSLIDALKMLKAGADLIGTSSGLNILAEVRSILRNEK